MHLKVIMQRRDYVINLLLILLVVLLLAICIGSITGELRNSGIRQRTEHAISE